MSLRYPKNVMHERMIILAKVVHHQSPFQPELVFKEDFGHIKHSVNTTTKCKVGTLVGNIAKMVHLATQQMIHVVVMKGVVGHVFLESVYLMYKVQLHAETVQREKVVRTKHVKKWVVQMITTEIEYVSVMIFVTNTTAVVKMWSICVVVSGHLL
eukprot:UN28967